jgi:hypothetical protein
MASLTKGVDPGLRFVNLWCRNQDRCHYSALLLTAERRAEAPGEARQRFTRSLFSDMLAA